MSDTLISALCWVRKGYAQSQPREYELEEEDIHTMKQDPSIQQSIQQAQKIQKQHDKEKKKNQKQEQEEEWDEEEYQEGDEDDDENHVPTFTAEYAMMKKGIPEFDKDGYKFAYDDISNEDKEDYLIKPSDALLVAAKIEKEFSSLEVYVYEQEKSSLFVHHEITLSAFPLAIEWLPLNPSTFQGNSADQGNFAIVGTFLPEIEIWNLDIINAIEPAIILGGEIDQESQSYMEYQQKQQQKTKKGKKVKQFHQQQKQSLFKEGSHTNSVLSLNLNSFRQNILVSGSADQTVKIWDIAAQKNLHTFANHSDKVQLVSWNKQQEAVLLSGGYDKNIILQDVRQPQNALKTVLNSEVEAGGWIPQDENLLYVSTEDGNVAVLDARKFDQGGKKNNNTQYVANFKAHAKQTTSVSFNSHVPGMMSTTSMDKTVKIWDMQSISNQKPKLVASKMPNAGGLFCGSFYQDSAWVFGCGNGKGEVFVWDTAEDKRIIEAFGGRVSENIKPDIQECTQGDQVVTHEKPQSDDDDDDDDLYNDDDMEESQQIMEQE